MMLSGNTTRKLSDRCISVNPNSSELVSTCRAEACATPSVCTKSAQAKIGNDGAARHWCWCTLDQAPKQALHWRMQHDRPVQLAQPTPLKGKASHHATGLPSSGPAWQGPQARPERPKHGFPLFWAAYGQQPAPRHWLGHPSSRPELACKRPQPRT